MQFLCKVPCVFISWVAFLIQDTEEWKPCIVNTQCGRCYRQITRCYSQTYNTNPCQEPCTMQALFICYLIYPSQPTKAGTLGNILTLQMSNLRWRTSLSLPEDPESEEEGWGSHSVGLCRETPPPAHPVLEPESWWWECPGLTPQRLHLGLLSGCGNVLSWSKNHFFSLLVTGARYATVRVRCGLLEYWLCPIY